MDRYNDYYEKEALSQSYLKGIMSESYVESKPNKIKLLKGSLTDMILTSPDEVDQTFIFEDIKDIGGKTGELVNLTIDTCLENDISIDFNNPEFISVLENVRESLEYQTNWKKDTFINNIQKEEEYFQSFAEAHSQGKILMSKLNYDLCYNYATFFSTSESTSKYLELEEGEEFLFQHPLYATLEGELCKGLPDIIIINHNKKYVKLYDLKVTGARSRKEYISIVRRFRYDLQLSFYVDLLNEVFPDYKVVSTALLVLSSHNPSKPFVLHLTPRDLFIGKYGCEITTSSTSVRDTVTNNKSYIFGYKDCINKHKQLKELNLPDTDIDYYINKGNFELNLF